MTVLFKDSAAAIVYALNFNKQQYPQSPAAKMVKSNIVGSGKGLVGTDGAAQAGFILASVKRLSEIEQACIVARHCLKYIPCACGNLCCSEETIEKQYKDAIVFLDEEIAQKVVTGISKRQMRWAIIRHYFERKQKGRKDLSIGQHADKLKVARRTAYDHKTKIDAALLDVDKTARTKIDSYLSPMIGELDEATA